MLKTLLKSLFRSLGYEVSKINPPPPGSKFRPMGVFPSFLEDVRARGFVPSFVLDVGGNLGEWTRMAKAVFPEASFLLIEPQIETKPSLDALCTEFNDVSWVLAGAGATPGQLVQTVGGDLGASSFLPAPDPALLRAGRQRTVDIVTIDALLESRGLAAPGLVKLDVQGFELEALKGAPSLFGKTELFVLEASLYSFSKGWPLVSEVVAFMHSRGYELYDIPGSFRRPLDGALGQVDLAFARRSGSLRQAQTWD
jgi:FkbM family methyltransferase